MADLGDCFICGEKATYKIFYDVTAGRFIPDEEPRLCSSCNVKLERKTDNERRLLFAGFRTMHGGGAA